MKHKIISKYTLAALLSLLISFSLPSCTPQGMPNPENPGTEETPGDDNPDNPDDPNNPDDPDNPDNPDNPNNPDNPDNPDDPDNPDNPGDTPAEPNIKVIDRIDPPASSNPSPQHPDLVHQVEYTEFYNTLQDELDEFGNVDYVCSQGNGTAWPLLLENGHIRFYQGSNANKGGSYMRVRAKNGAQLLSVTFGTATSTSLAHTLNGKARKSETTKLEAGDRYTVSGTENCTDVCVWCMGTSQDERWELDYIKVEYKGGYIESDFYQEEKECGPLVQTDFPFIEDFEKGFPTTDKPSYYKYGITAGRENLEWSTWYGSFSWQNPIQEGQSTQLRIYQFDEEYIGSQLGYLKMEFFLKDLKQVSFKYWYSEFWCKATISYCVFGENEWKNPQQIGLTNYGDRKTTQDYTYILDNGTHHDAKIRIEIDEATSYPDSGHSDFIFDCFRFE